MNAEEIRSITAHGEVGEFMLQEIAAQLAEANEHLVNTESRWVWLTYKGHPFVVDRNEVTGIALLFHNNMQSRVSIGMKGQPWSKSADGTVEEVCAKLGIPLEGK